MYRHALEVSIINSNRLQSTYVYDCRFTFTFIQSLSQLVFNVLCVETDTGGEDLGTVHDEEAK